jgi:hydrogenase expression/formation protein HypE
MTHEYPEMQGLVCPVPLAHAETIVMGHGSGGKLMHDLIARHFLPHFANPILQAGDDAGLIEFDSAQNQSLRLAISTDSHVVWPLIFPGGDIGRLAVCGTVNDIAMLGAQPLYLTAGFILEEGLQISILECILASMQAAALEADIQIVAGDTKVVQKGKADGLYINTAGVGRIDPAIHISGANAQPGDVVLLSGSLGEHGIAVLEARGELGFTSQVQSDVAPLNHMIGRLLQAGCQVHVLRDPTRGGLATTLNEIASQSGVAIVLDETSIPVKPAVAAACEMLGFDPLYIANEGKLVVILPASDAQKALDLLHSDPLGANAALIGVVKAEPRQRVLLKTVIGATRIVDVLSGELLPRIC